MAKAKKQDRLVVADAVDADGVLVEPTGSVRVFAVPGKWDGMALWELIAAHISCWQQNNPWDPWTQGKDGRVLVNSKTDGTLYYLVDCELITARGDDALTIGLKDVCADATDGVLELGPTDVPKNIDPNACVEAAPELTAISPATGDAAGGTAFTLTGKHLTGLEGVNIGGVGATSVVVVDDTKVTGVTGAHAAGAVDVVAQGPGGESNTLTGAFTYTATPPPPAVVVPSAGVVGEAFTVTGTGWTYGGADDVVITVKSESGGNDLLTREATVGQDGTFRQTDVIIPEDSPAGAYVVTVTQGSVVKSGTITVTAAPAVESAEEPAQEPAGEAQDAGSGDADQGDDTDGSS